MSRIAKSSCSPTSSTSLLFSSIKGVEFGNEEDTEDIPTPDPSQGSNSTWQDPSLHYNETIATNMVYYAAAAYYCRTPACETWACG
jgi:hypothetical protein